MSARRKVRPRYRRKKLGSMKWLMNILTFILILFALYYFVHSSFFALSSIQVTGMKQIASKDIINLSGLAKGENIFKIDLKAAEKKIYMNSMVSAVKVKRQLPDTIIIKVKERTSVALIPISGGLIQVDGEGYILKKDHTLSNQSYPIITGLNLPDTLAVGKKINSNKLAMGLKMIAQMDAKAKKEIAEIDVFDPQKLRAFTIEGAEVRLGDAEGFAEKFNKFLQILKKEQDLNRLDDIEYIDVSFSDKPVVFYRKN